VDGDPPRLLVLVSGLPSTGKSTVVTGLTSALAVSSISRDWVRRQLLDAALIGFPRRYVPRRAHPPRPGHSAVVQSVANRVLIEVARRLLTTGGGVIVEAVADCRLRASLADLAVQITSRFVQLECVFSDEAAWTERLRTRSLETRLDWERMVRRLGARYSFPANATVLETHEPWDQVMARAREASARRC
jgi:uncharacterized protein